MALPPTSSPWPRASPPVCPWARCCSHPGSPNTWRRAISARPSAAGRSPCASAVANLEVIRDEDLPGRALHLERRLRQGLADLPAVTEITGLGLLLGLVLDRPARPVQLALFERGILVGSANDPSIIRLLPPLVLTDDEVDTFVQALHEVLS